MVVQKEKKRESDVNTKPLNDPIDEETSQLESKNQDARVIVMKYVKISAGTALIPLPYVDMLAVSVIELKMLKELCDHYEIEFSKEKGKSLIASLTGGMHAGLLMGRLLKTIPVVGMALAIAPIIIIFGAITYAVGVVFIKHFESGGTLLDFSPSKRKKLFSSKMREGKKIVSELSK